MNQNNDLISRQGALDAIMGQPPEPHYPAWYAAQIEKLPAAQPEHVADIGKKFCVDTISRQAALKKLAVYIHLIDKTMGKGTLTDDDCMEAAKSVLGEDELPAAQPERKRGEWIPVTYRYVPVKDGSLNTKIIWIDATEPDDIEGMKCSECGTVFDFTEARNWCSECGADMRKENES